MTRTEQLERRVRLLLLLFIAGLVVSGVTAFPLETELRWLTGALGAGPGRGRRRSPACCGGSSPCGTR